jgi:hypothetical protein
MRFAAVPGSAELPSGFLRLSGTGQNLHVSSMVCFLLVDDDFEFLLRLDGHILRFGLAVQDVRRHFTGLDAQLVVVDAQGQEAAGLDFARFSAHDGELRFVGDFGQRRHGTGHDIVRRDVEYIHFANEAARSLLDIIDIGYGCFDNRQAYRCGFFLQDVHLGLGIDFAGTVDNADTFRLREHFVEHGPPVP